MSKLTYVDSQGIVKLEKKDMSEEWVVHIIFEDEEGKQHFWELANYGALLPIVGDVWDAMRKRIEQKSG